ncbi:type II toxin-antitoxin system mRNA interferase toxin, RelE/StbE family [Candidatus Roizmanbacteria bacterium CG02_land_8_20_14_3_00_36_15]|uniref:Type II toxin-antitoxin system mRNA interferase toxin, RelE/StbE family n=1 Tax=Candidatus Roizmanbacteria bacterium CG_4_8_14_3_um_filter_36_10 TaxID=1974834 RepID=A0A2M8GNV2_9BACT|nr:MAG: type II toxin-antitoxin system mRNA interferase toxin, RelE/StbE family [Candidatus Roizmanbacteria bacterium CG03_land_8_20_14_0_80_36_21]PIV37417.1 MAG: type II toxin-antitoxin system mRNA interferase toxin, RelE/StbE family [Candidatus Roizmanbacteria bacterium CG02_land_8_20_14_3_00_36_15]PIY70492.1 MAG: type II toxin-antitoxin system mRNA interferase toxin, RelE/StbE family [Candidatus Roizmanbacteria bacterium CG_4_10_14_0_8_um_filter_36_36]PJA53306.1 MAG: type II toxin-antitoxin s
MIIYYSKKFEKEYKKLPIKIKILAEKKEKIFRKNPFAPSLRAHKLKGRLSEFWSFSIDLYYRIIFEFAKKETVWFYSVGRHSIYD